MALDWGYGQTNGPKTWPECFPDAAGPRQSPIDINPVDLKTLNTNRKLQWKYVPENTDEVSNQGYGWKVQVNGEGSELTGGPLDGKYVLEQFHCHWGESNDRGSEHTINGETFAGELHLVHWNSTKYRTFADAAKYPDGLAVLGVFLQPGRKHPELEKVVAQLNRIEYKGENAKINVPLNPAQFLPSNSGYYTYHGSLTTPPCSECVIWIVFKEPIEVSHDQLMTFRTMKSYSREDNCPCDEYKGFVKKNFRPTLPLGQREVKECRQ
ncbi:unnamed protein product [Phaedon cochleariae]|uniref:Carbonic anhydrase n=1 Tax=Phaedon cochleariae TaxID=80249 RepID=A0A9P0DMT9_PHACE|nr:unnamed protein product [Phaedon cochleariae]